MEGKLNKFTNVIMGWQYRWFVLEPTDMILEYFLLDDKEGRCRGRQRLDGARIHCSDEDIFTFTVNFKSGEVYKLRATDSYERQLWINNLKTIADSKALMDSNKRRPLQRYRVIIRKFCFCAIYLLINFRSTTSSQLPEPILNLSDYFPKSCTDNVIINLDSILLDVDRKQKEVSKVIDSLQVLPTQVTKLSNDEKTKKLLILKATSIATLQCLNNAQELLYDLQLNVATPGKIKNTGNN